MCDVINGLLDVEVPLVPRLRSENSEPSVGNEDGLVHAQDVRVPTPDPGDLKFNKMF